MDETQISVEEMKHDITSLSKRLDNLEVKFSDLNDSVKRALQILLPKVDSLVENEASDVFTNTSVADKTTSNAQSPLTLLQAAEDGDAEAILNLLMEGDVSQQNKDGDSALHVAARAGYKLVVIVLLERCPVDLPGHLGSTPLHYASAEGHVSIVETLLLAGADVDAKDTEGNFALLLAAKAGHLNVVELLANIGVSLDEVDKYRNTSLVAAAKAQKWDVVKLLLERGASAEIYDNDNYSNAPLYFVIKHKQYHLIPLMLKHMKQEETELKYALIHSDDDGNVPYIIEGVVPGFCKSQEAHDAMTSFAYSGKENMITAMLDIGADVNELNSSGLSCLVEAVFGAQVNTLKLLLHRGASVNLVVSYDDNTALHYAADRGHVECVNALLHAGAAVDIRNINDKTPMDMAKTDEIRQILSSHSSQS